MPYIFLLVSDSNRLAYVGRYLQHNSRLSAICLWPWFSFVYGNIERKLGSSYPIKRTLISLGILLLNFPVEALALYSAVYITSTNTATVINNSSYEVTDMVLSERDQSYSLPPIMPGQEITEHFHFKYEGAVEYRLSINGSVKTGIMFGYVTGGMGESATMVITSDGAVEIRR